MSIKVNVNFGFASQMQPRAFQQVKSRTEAAQLADERYTLRQRNPADPNIRALSNRIKKMVNDPIRNKWRNYLDKCSFNLKAKNLWQVVKKLTNKSGTSDNISFSGPPLTSHKRCVTEFNRKFNPHRET